MEVLPAGLSRLTPNRNETSQGAAERQDIGSFRPCTVIYDGTDKKLETVTRLHSKSNAVYEELGGLLID